MKQEPWQWRRGRVGIDAQVDYEGLLEATFRGSLEAAFRDSWKQHVQDTIIRLLEMVDGVVAKGLMFRSVEQPSKAVWFPPPTQKPVPLKVLGCCVGVNKYKSDQLSNLQNCVSDAEAIAEGFCSAEYRSRGISVDVTNIRTSGQLLEALNDELDPIIKEHSATLRTLVVPFACHALQLDGEVYLIPPGADFTESSNEQRFKNSVSDQCLALSDVVSEITKLMDDAMHELAASSSVFVKDCRCIFILDTCRDQGFTCAGTKPHASITETFLKPKEPTVCNHLFMFSTSQGKCASDGGAREGHSLYTATLLEHLFVPGKRLIDVQTATENALKAINQTPTWHGPSNVQNSVLFENCGPAAAGPEDACNSLHEQPGHRRNNERPYDMYFAVQPVPNAVESLCTRLPGQAAPDKLSCLEHHACKRRIQDYLQERQVDGKLKYKAMQFRQREKKKMLATWVEKGSVGTWGGLSQFCAANEKERVKATLAAVNKPFTDNTPYVLNNWVVNPDDGICIIVQTTENLMLNAYRHHVASNGGSLVLGMDHTYRLMKEGHATLLLTTTAPDQTCHIIAYATCTDEKTSSIVQVLEQVALEAQAIVVHRAKNNIKI